MADITMCRDKDCKVNHICHRFTETPDPHRQPYFAESPRQPDGKCKYFWDTRKTIDLTGE